MKIIAGPCQIEDRSMCYELAEQLRELTIGHEFYFKSSFDKANRTHSKAHRGVGFDIGMDTLYNVKEKSKGQTKILTDVHERWQCGPVCEIIDAIQIPAFLSRQTDLIEEACQEAKTQSSLRNETIAINVKKGQWMAPWDAEQILSKTESAPEVWITERGTSFGYNRLVVDFAGLQWMKANLKSEIIFDATHSVQLPGGGKYQSLGNREYVLGLARAAVAMGVDGIFCEVHPNPDAALSDASTQITPEMFEHLMHFINHYESSF